MGRAKEIEVKIINSKVANEFVKKTHYSKSVVMNSLLHFGCFLDGMLHGVLQYGNSIDKRNTIGFVDTGMTINQGWNSFVELNRMAFDSFLPKNSESRCIAITIRMIKKQAPQIKWILSYADGTQCGDGTIYRASGFKLCGINKNSTIYEMKDGSSKAKHGTSKADFSGAKKKKGYQFRYIYLIDKKCELNIKEIPFSKIKEIGAGMYKGKKKL
tara:strand:+ start:343 stop:984 length:642 start_codon:yes stop_codon:yes gene_type:complete